MSKALVPAAGGKPPSAKQTRFVEEYLVDLNATQAAVRAGYSPKTAYAQGQRLLKNVEVQTAITAGQAARSQRTEITQDRVLQELARIGFADVRNLFEWDEETATFIPSRDLTADQAAAIASVEAETTTTTDLKTGERETTVKLKLKTYDKLGALEKLGKHLGMFVDRVEHTGADGTPLFKLYQGIDPDQV